MTANEWGIDSDLDPRSFKAACQYHAVRQAEEVVRRAERGPVRGITNIMFDALRQARDEETTA